MILERFQFYLKHSINDMRVNKIRTAFGLFCIAAGVAAIVSLLTLGVMIEDTLSGSLQESNRSDMQIRPFDVFEEDVDESDGDGRQIEDFAITPFGFQEIDSWLSDWFDDNYPEVEDPYILTTRGDEEVNLITNLSTGDESFTGAFIIDSDQYPLYGEIRSRDDEQLLSEMIDISTYGEGESNGDIVLSINLADDISAKIGDIVRIRFEETSGDFRVTGFVDTRAEGGLDNPIIGIFGFYYLDLQGRNVVPNMSQNFSRIYVKLSDPSILGQLNTDFNRAFPDLSTRTTDDLQEDNEALSTFVTQLVSTMGLLSMLIGGIGIVNTMIVVVRRRTNEVAILKTLGLQPSEITVLFFVEAVLMGAVGSIIGIFLGFGLVNILAVFAEAFIAQSLTFRIAATPVITGFVVGVLVTTVFGILPTISASQVRPATVLRPQDNIVPKSGILRSFAALLVVIIALSIIAQGMLGDLLSGDDAESLELYSSIVIFIMGGLIALAMFIGGIFSDWTKSNILLKIVRVVLLFTVLPISGYLLGKSLPAVLLIWVVFVIAGVLYTMLWFIIWLVGRFFTSVIDLPFRLVGVVIPFVRDLSPSIRFVDLKISLRSMLASKGRGASMLLALVVGVFTLSLITMLVSTIKDAFEELLIDVTGGNIIAFVDGEGASLSQAEEKLNAGIDGVQTFALIRSYDARFESFTDVSANQTLDEADVRRRISDSQGFGASAEDFFEEFEEVNGRSLQSNLPDVKFDAGRQLTMSDMNKPVIIVPSNFNTQELDYAVGDQLTLRFVTEDEDVSELVTFEIVGITGGTSDALEGFGSSYYFPIEFLPEGEEFSVQPTSLAVVINADEDKIRSVRNELREIQGVFVLETRLLNDLVNRIIDSFTNFPIIVAGLALFTGGVVIANSVALSMMERRREIAIMKAVGLARRRVLGMLLMENGIMGFIGGLIGVGISAIILYLMLEVVFEGELGTSIPYVTAFILMGLCIFIALVASMFSVFSAASEKPLNVLRYE